MYHTHYAARPGSAPLSCARNLKHVSSTMPFRPVVTQLTKKNNEECDVFKAAYKPYNRPSCFCEHITAGAKVPQTILGNLCGNTRLALLTPCTFPLGFNQACVALYFFKQNHQRRCVGAAPAPCLVLLPPVVRLIKRRKCRRGESRDMRHARL